MSTLEPVLTEQWDALATFPAFLTRLVEIWPAHAFKTLPKAGGLSLSTRICTLRDVEYETHAVRIRKLLWSEAPSLDVERPTTLKYQEEAWRIALYELFQLRLGNVAALRRADADSYRRYGSLGSNTHFTLHDLIVQMLEHDIGQTAELFQLACECGAWPETPTARPVLSVGR